MSRLPARTGWLWLKQGAGLFRKQPAGLTTLLFANILVSLALGFVPIIGPILAIVLIPSFSVAFMQACLMIDRGQRVTPAVLVTGFRKPGVVALCKVGLIHLAVFALIGLIMRYGVDESLLKQLASPQDAKSAATLHLSDLMALLAIVLFEIAALTSLCFAAPLTYWQKMGPAKAVFYSFFAVLRSARVFMVLLLGWFSILFLIWMAVIAVFGDDQLARVVLMWIAFLFVLLLQCSIYAGYREIFGVPEDAAKVDLLV